MNLSDELEKLTEEDNAIDSSIALNKILHSLLIENKRQNFRLWIVILCLIGVIITGIVSFFVYESQFEQEETTTETTWSYAEASGENAAINNVQGDQYNDRATRNNYCEEE